MKRLRAGYKAPIIAAEDGRDIYGLTVNYGALKEKRVTDGEKGKAGVEEEPNRSASIAFNERQMRIQAAGFEPFLPERTAKMAMVIRLNQMAAGYTAMSEDAARAYAEYVNNDVTPLIPLEGLRRRERPELCHPHRACAHGRVGCHVEGRAPQGGGRPEGTRFEAFPPVRT